MFAFDVGEDGSKVGELIEQLRWLTSMGIQTVLGVIPHVYRIEPLEVIGRGSFPPSRTSEHARPGLIETRWNRRALHNATCIDKSVYFIYTSVSTSTGCQRPCAMQSSWLVR